MTGRASVVSILDSGKGVEFMVTERESYERFARDIEKHELTVLRSDGVYRHIRCSKSNSSDMHFEIVTWPGYLAYVGDMGAYTFQRTEDMFEFFRRPDGKINPRYWSEKVEAYGRLMMRGKLERAYRFLWCCHAIVWAVNKFDAMTEAKS